MEQLINEMISITEGKISLEQAKKYIQMGKMDLTKALNIYFQSEERKSRQKPCVLTQTLMEGAKKQQKLQKMIKDLKDEYNKPIEDCLDIKLQEERKEVKLNFQSTSDIEEIAIQLAQKRNQQKQEQEQEKITQNITLNSDVKKKVKQTTQKISQQAINVNQNQQKQTMQIQNDHIEEQFEQKTECKSQKQVQILKNGVQYPLYIGSAQVKGYTIGNQNLKNAQQQELNLSVESQIKDTLKFGKKGGKQSKGQNIIRILYQDNEIGRLNQEFEDLLAPLISDNFIIIHGQHICSPILCKTHDLILLKLDVLLTQKSITDTTEDSFDDTQQIYSKIKENFQKLFDLLDCEQVIPTLIDVNRKKIILQQTQENNDSNTNTKSIVIYQNDPFKQKPKQASLFDFKLKQKSQQIVSEEFEIQQEEQEGQLNDDECEKLLGLKQCQHYNLQLHNGPLELSTQLFDYQKQALTWLLQREGAIESQDQENKRALHPLWQQYQTKQGLLFYFNPFSGQTSLQFPSSSKRCYGGILADEMGLGKTVMLIALIIANPFKKPDINVTKIHKQRQSQKKEKKLIADYVGYEKKKWGKTLIIVPVSLIQQWQDELRFHCKNELKIHQYTGQERNQYDLSQFDVIVSSYNTISAEFKKQTRDPYSVYNYNWFRVILDEAHYIKGRTTLIAQAAYELDCHFRWCSTGTPIQNNLNDMFSLIHFIKLEPWSEYLWWNAYINKQHEENSQKAFTLLNIILTPILLRRTKKSKDQSGKAIINLPEKQIKFEYIQLKDDERMIYDSMEKKSQEEVEGYLAKGILMSQYMKVFELLIRLRQICDHPLLILARSDVKNIDHLEEQIDKFLNNQALDREDQEELLINNQQLQVCLNRTQYKQEVIRRVQQNDIPPCPICLEPVEDAVVTICLHFLCRLCLHGLLANKSECPYCRKFLTKQDTMTLPRESSFSLNWKENYRRSSKIQKIMEIINNIPSSEKCVIFTQFIGMIEMIEFDLDQQNISHLRLDGSMPQQKRAEVLAQFKEDSSQRIFIVSLKAGGVGLNLTAANHVIMIDPWWNPAVEEQAIERIYRIGQTKEVFVYRLICSKTVEERMIQMQDVKKQLFESSIVMTEEKKSVLRMEMFKNIIMGQ